MISTALHTLRTHGSFCIYPLQPPHTEIEFRPLYLALLGVIGRLIFGGGRVCSSGSLLQKRVCAHRCWDRGRVEEGDD